MKKKLFLGAVFAGMMAFTACTQEKVVYVEEEKSEWDLQPGEDVIKISLSSTVSSRAARPIGSSTPAHNVNRIAFKFLKGDDTEDSEPYLVELFDATSDWSIQENVIVLGGDYMGEELNVKVSGLTKGLYKIIAYGYNCVEEGSYDFPYTMELEQAGDGNHLYKADVPLGTAVEEIFAGCNKGAFVEVNQHGKFTAVPEIELTRQVAGLLAYFENVPAYVNNQKVEKITVSSKAKVEGFYFPARMLNSDGSLEDYNGFDNGTWVSDDWVDHLTFDMAQASNYPDADEINSVEHYEFDSTGGFLLANETSDIPDLSCKDGTLFGSCFLLPYPVNHNFSEGSSCATLNICYWTGDDKDQLICSIPLRNGGDVSTNLDSDYYQYDICCNHFYSIGKKTDVGGDNGEDDPLDIDEPTGYDNAKVNISINWEQSYYLFNNND